MNHKIFWESNTKTAQEQRKYQNENPQLENNDITIE